MKDKMPTKPAKLDYGVWGAVGLLILAMVLALGMGGCGSDQAVQGKPLAEWVAMTDLGNPGRDHAINLLVDLAVNKQDKRVAPMLIQRVKVDGKFEAAEVLGKIGPQGADSKQAVAALHDAIKSNQFSLVRAASRALPKFGAEAQVAIPTLVNILAKHEVIEMRECAAETLGLMNGYAVSAEAALQQAASAAGGDPAPAVQRAAAEALRAINPTKFGPPKNGKTAQ